MKLLFTSIARVLFTSSVVVSISRILNCRVQTNERINIALNQSSKYIKQYIKYECMFNAPNKLIMYSQKLEIFPDPMEKRSN